MVDDAVTYLECQDCTVDKCINIVLQHDIEIETQEELQIEIKGATLGSIGLSTTTIFINDVTGEQYIAVLHSLIEIAITIDITLEIVPTPSDAGPEGSAIDVCLQFTSQASISTDLIAMVNLFQVPGIVHIMYVLILPLYDNICTLYNRTG